MRVSLESCVKGAGPPRSPCNRNPSSGRTKASGPSGRRDIDAPIFTPHTDAQSVKLIEKACCAFNDQLLIMDATFLSIDHIAPITSFCGD